MSMGDVDSKALELLRVSIEALTRQRDEALAERDEARKWERAANNALALEAENAKLRTEVQLLQGYCLAHKEHALKLVRVKEAAMRLSAAPLGDSEEQWRELHAALAATLTV